jgi:serine/threonine protein phosphatase PrpC
VTQAFVASRLVRGLTEAWFVARSASGRAGGPAGDDLDADDPAHHLADHLRAGLADAARGLVEEPTGVRSSMHRTLPTTLAALVLRDAGAGAWALDAVWAGDSRAYVLRPSVGLQQLTRDHVRHGDALEQLLNDQPMSNVLSASTPFRAQHQHRVVEGPCLAVCATDGVFAYVQTPGQTEHVLLETLQTAASPEGWADAVAARVEGYTADDASLVVAWAGWPGFDAMRADFAERAERVAEAQRGPFDGVSPAEGDRFARLREAAWRAYAPDYERLLPDGGGA